MRLLFVTGSLAHGGAERHTLALANRLNERGHECHVAHVKDDAGLLEQLPLAGRAPPRSLEASRYLEPRAVARLARHAAALRPDAVVAVNGYALMHAWLALRGARLRTPLAVTYHSTKLLGAKQQLQMALYRLFFWSADCTVFVCDSQRRHWRRRGVFSRRNVVIYNGVDTDAFCDVRGPEERARLRAASGFAATDYVIGMSALLRPEKNHVQLVDAVARLRNRGVPARALMIGDGETRGAVEARALALGVSRDVAITGVQQDVRPYIEACDVMALCSVTEAFSLAAIEAMAMRRPVIHSDVGGAREMIVPGRNGFLFPAGNTGALVEKLAVLADRVVSEKMGQDAREVVKARFSERAMVDRYEQTLLEL
ncbi:MAG: glycosyltransferase family 4 protein [Betaproteobacteria bacterium]|nr:glycosyltransferase family 4 protein [Betaproteobacteria bacterium]